jgi:hypothetical protein
MSTGHVKDLLKYPHTIKPQNVWQWVLQMWICGLWHNVLDMWVVTQCTGYVACDTMYWIRGLWHNVLDMWVVTQCTPAGGFWIPLNQQNPPTRLHSFKAKQTTIGAPHRLFITLINCSTFHISQPYEGVLLSINVLQIMGDHGCRNLNPVHFSVSFGIWNISHYYLCHSWAWEKNGGYDIFLHLVSETNTVVAFTNESSLCRTQSMWKNFDIIKTEK